jgi:hypothetical protein
MSDTSLIFSIIARDKTTATLKKLEAQAAGTGKTIGFALGPALLPVAAVGLHAVASLGTALAGAGLAAGVFGAVAKSAMTEVSQNATKVTDLTDKIKLYQTEIQHANEFGVDSNKIADQQAKAMLELKSRLIDLPPATRDATMAYIDMQAGWGGFVENNKPATFGIMTQGYKILSTAIGQLQPFFDMGANAARRLATAIQGGLNNGVLSHLATSAGPALGTLTDIIINMGQAIAATFGKIGAAQGQGILEWINSLIVKWKDWAQSTNQKTGINSFITYATQNGPRVAALLGNLATAVFHIAQAASPLAPISLAIAGALTRMVAAIPQSWLTAIIAGFIAFNVAMKVYTAVTKIAAVVQWAMNSALLASPITWIVLAIVALVAVIVLVATKTRFFQTIWGAVWGFMKGVGAWFAGPFAHFFVVAWGKILTGLNAAKHGVLVAVNFIKNYYVGMWNIFSSIVTKTINGGVRLVNWFKAAPGKIGNALRSMFGGLWSGFRGYVNRIIGAWNRLQFTIGGGSFMGVSIPSFSVGTPDIPYMASGGKIMRDGLIFAHAGETVTKKAQVTRTGSGTGTNSDGGATLTIRGDGSKTSRFLLELLREAIRDKGGDPVKVLTPA